MLPKKTETGCHNYTISVLASLVSTHQGIKASISSTTAVYCSKIVQILHSKRHQRFQVKDILLMEEIPNNHLEWFSNPINNGIVIILAGAGFCPSTVLYVSSCCRGYDVPLRMLCKFGLQAWPLDVLQVALVSYDDFAEILRPVDKSYQLPIPSQNWRTFGDPEGDQTFGSLGWKPQETPRTKKYESSWILVGFPVLLKLEVFSHTPLDMPPHGGLQTDSLRGMQAGPSGLAKLPSALFAVGFLQKPSAKNTKQLLWHMMSELLKSNKWFGAFKTRADTFCSIRIGWYWSNDPFWREE